MALNYDKTIISLLSKDALFILKSDFSQFFKKFDINFSNVRQLIWSGNDIPIVV